MALDRADYRTQARQLLDERAGGQRSTFWKGLPLDAMAAWVILGRTGRAAGLDRFLYPRTRCSRRFQQAIVDCLRENGFEPLAVVELEPALISAIANEVRGGNWGRGPFPVSGGLPAVVCFGFDLLPRRVEERHRAEHPDSDNRRILEAKLAARDLVNLTLPKCEQFNPVHSTDNARQAWRAVRSIIPAREDELRQASIGYGAISKRAR